MFLGESISISEELYPVLKGGIGGDYILVYLSLNGIPTIPSHIALMQSNIDFEDYILEYCLDDENWNKNVKLGQILIRPADKLFNKNLLLVFVKNDIYDPISIEHIKTGLNRVFEVFEDYGIETISIDESLFEEGIFEDLIDVEKRPALNIY